MSSQFQRALAIRVEIGVCTFVESAPAPPERRGRADAQQTGIALFLAAGLALVGAIASGLGRPVASRGAEG
jgi:hypothetical protein